MRKYKITSFEKEKIKKEYNPEKLLLEIKKEIKEKGFSMIEVHPQKRLEFLYNLPKKYLLFYNPEIKGMGIFFAFILLFLYVVFIQGDIPQLLKTLLLPFFIGIYFFFHYLIHLEQQKRINDIDFSSISGIADKYICFTENYIFIDSKIIKYKFNELSENTDIYKKIFAPGEFYYELDYPEEAKIFYNLFSKRDKKSNQILKLRNTLALLEKYFEYTEKLQIRIEKELIKIKNGNFDLSKSNHAIEELNKTVKSSVFEMGEIFNILNKSGFEKFIDFTLLSIYLKNKFSFSIKFMQTILKKHIFLIKYIQKSNKKLDSKYITSATKRLNLYKNNLEKQIIYLEKYIL